MTILTRSNPAAADASRLITRAIALLHEAGAEFDPEVNQLLAVKLPIAQRLHCVQLRGR